MSSSAVCIPMALNHAARPPHHAAALYVPFESSVLGAMTHAMAHGKHIGNGTNVEMASARGGVSKLRGKRAIRKACLQR